MTGAGLAGAPDARRGLAAGARVRHSPAAAIKGRVQPMPGPVRVSTFDLGVGAGLLAPRPAR
jgi:hypothetical protein